MQDPRGAARSLISEGLLLELVGIEPERIVLRARSCAGGACCPAGGKDAARARQRLPRRMLSGFSSAREAFTAEDVEHFVRRLREPSRARAGSALYRHFIQPETARIMTGSYRGRRLSTPARVLQGADDPIVRPEFIHGVEDHVDALDTQIVAGASRFIVEDMPGVVVARALDFFAP